MHFVNVFEDTAWYRRLYNCFSV